MTLPVNLQLDWNHRLPSRRVRGRDVLVVAAVLGVLTGGVAWGTQLLWSGLGLRWERPHPWAGVLIPLTHVVVLAAAALPLAVAARGGGVAASPRVIATALVLVAWATLAPLLHPEVHWAALALLSAGVVVQGGAALARRWSAAARAARAGWWPLVAALAVLVLAGPAWRSVGEARAPSPPAGRGQPNILLVVLDTVRARNMGFLGYPRPTTPFLDDLARRGVVFERAYATSSWTLPTHASLFTGLPPGDHGADWVTPLPERPPTLAEILTLRGYRTAGIVANWSQAGRHTGLDRGFGTYDDRVSLSTELVVASALGRAIVGALGRLGAPIALYRNKDAEEVGDRFLRWLNESGDRPFFAFLNYMDAHESFRARAEDLARFHSLERPDRPYRSARPRAYADRWIDRYDAQIGRIDADLERVIRVLETRGDLRDTIIVVTADHGEEFGEKGAWGHGQNLYSPTLQVPLLIVAPGRVPAGRRVGTPVSLTDVPATVLGVAGLGRALSGNSLSPCWRDAPCGDRLAPLAARLTQRVRRGRDLDDAGQSRSLIWRGIHYVRRIDGGEEIYSLREDPWEQDDLSRTEAGSAWRSWFRGRLQAGD